MVKNLKFKLPLFYFVLILVGQVIIGIPALNECSGGIGAFCLPASVFIVMLIGAPGGLLIEGLRFMLPKEYYAWRTYSENLTAVMTHNYIVTMALVFLVGLAIDMIRDRKRTHNL